MVRRSARVFVVVTAFAAIASPDVRAQIPISVTRASFDVGNGVEGNADSGGKNATHGVPANVGVATNSSYGGQYSVFMTAAGNFVSNDLNGVNDVYYWDTNYQAPMLVSTNGATAGNGDSFAPCITKDGQYVAFCSAASDLVSGDTNGKTDVFKWDAYSNIITRVSVSGLTQGNGLSKNPSYTIVAGSHLVAFESRATNLAAGATNGSSQILLKNLTTGTVTLVSCDNGSPGVQGDGDSSFASISVDGNYVAFESMATNLVAGDTNGVSDVFVRDLVQGVTTRVSVNSLGLQANRGSHHAGVASFTTIGTPTVVVPFVSTATNLVGGDTNGCDDVFARNVTTGVTTRLSVDSSGAEGDGPSGFPSICEDGHLVAFRSDATKLVASDVNGLTDVFIHDRVGGATTLMSISCTGQQGDGNSYCPSITADGQTTIFTTEASNLVAGDTNSSKDVEFATPRTATDATWQNYGSGLAGTNGIPTLTASADPIYGTTITVTAGNSRGASTIGFLLTGLSAASTPYAGGTLLVNFITLQGIAIQPGGCAVNEVLTNPVIFGLTVDQQVIEVDPGAVQGKSFTPGLQLVLGDY